MNAILDDAILLTQQRWLFFQDRMVFEPHHTLRDIILAFSVPMIEGLKANFAALDDETPPGIFFLVIAKGIVRSGTHPKWELEEALGFPIPD